MQLDLNVMFVIIKLCILMFRLFWRKIFSIKYFSYLLVFGAIENNIQIKNIFDLTKKTSLVSENNFYF
jgi:hypothetical protein